MDKDEALKLALEALKEPKEHIAKHRRLEAITAIKEVLAEPEQEPKRYTGGNGTAGREADVRPTGFFFQMPSQRKWVGLTSKEVDECFKITPDQCLSVQIYKRIGAKLREKNGG